MEFSADIFSEKKSAREVTYSYLKDQIMKLDLKPGTKISESGITNKLQISRTPVREAFLRLAQEELIEIYPQRGTRVSKIDLDHVEEARFLRENTERGIVKLACREFPEDYMFQLEMNLTMQELCERKRNHSRLYELDEEFHRILYYGSNKMRVWNLLQHMNIHFNRLRVLRLSSELNWDIIISQHKRIFQLIQSKNVQKVDEIVTEHLQLAVVEKEVLKESYPDYFK